MRVPGNSPLRAYCMTVSLSAWRSAAASSALRVMSSRIFVLFLPDKRVGPAASAVHALHLDFHHLVLLTDCGGGRCSGSGRDRGHYASGSVKKITVDYRSDKGPTQWIWHTECTNLELAQSDRERPDVYELLRTMPRRLPHFLVAEFAARRAPFSVLLCGELGWFATRRCYKLITGPNLIQKDGATPCKFYRGLNRGALAMEESITEPAGIFQPGESDAPHFVIIRGGPSQLWRGSRAGLDDRSLVLLRRAV